MELSSLAKKINGSIEYFTEQKEVMIVTLGSDTLYDIQRTKNAGQAFRVVKNGKFGFATGTLDIESKAILDLALSLARDGVKIDIQFPKSVEKTIDQQLDPSLVEMDIPGMIELGEQIIKNINCKKEIKIIVEKEVYKKTLKNSLGIKYLKEKALIKVRANALLVSQNDITNLYETYCSTKLYNFQNLIDSININYAMCQEYYNLRSGKYSVVFSPRAFASILMAFEKAFNAKSIFSGVSFLSGQLGKQVFDRKFSFYDNPNLKNAICNEKFDDEGLQTKIKSLVYRGRVEQYYSDLLSAEKFNLNNKTGNGIRRNGFPSIPTPNLFNLVVDPGDISKTDLISGIKEGIYIETLMGSNRGYNSIQSSISLGYKIENGRVKGKVKDVVIKCYYKDLLNDIILSKEREMIFGSFYLPYMYKKELNFYTA